MNLRASTRPRHGRRTVDRIDPEDPYRQGVRDYEAGRRERAHVYGTLAEMQAYLAGYEETRDEAAQRAEGGPTCGCVGLCPCCADGCRCCRQWREADPLF